MTYPKLLDKCFDPGFQLAHILHAVIGFDAQAGDIFSSRAFSTGMDSMR